MAAKQNRESELAKNKHGQGFPDRPAGEKSRYDPDQEMPDPEQVEREIVEREIKDTEKVYKKKDESAA